MSHRSVSSSVKWARFHREGVKPPAQCVALVVLVLPWVRTPGLKVCFSDNSGGKARPKCCGCHSSAAPRSQPSGPRVGWRAQPSNRGRSLADSAFLNHFGLGRGLSRGAEVSVGRRPWPRAALGLPTDPASSAATPRSERSATSPRPPAPPAAQPAAPPPRGARAARTRRSTSGHAGGLARSPPGAAGGPGGRRPRRLARSQPHSLNPCIVLAESPGGSRTGGAERRDEGGAGGRGRGGRGGGGRQPPAPRPGGRGRSGASSGPRAPAPRRPRPPLPPSSNFPSARARLSSGTGPAAPSPAASPGRGASS